MVGADGPKSRKRKGGNGWLERTARRAEREKVGNGWLERTARRAEREKVGNEWLERTARRAERGKPSPAEAGLGKDWKAGRPERPKEIKWDNLSPIS